MFSYYFNMLISKMNLKKILFWYIFSKKYCEKQLLSQYQTWSYSILVFGYLYGAKACLSTSLVEIQSMINFL